MQVKVANKMYQMSQKGYKGLLEIAKEQVPFGVYAIECKDYVELRHDKCTSMTQLKGLKRQFRSKGFRVLYNSG